jgi:hypothetical protein
VPVLARKPGALRNGAPFEDWVLPAAMERVRRKLAGATDGNRQMVDILTRGALRRTAGGRSRLRRGDRPRRSFRRRRPESEYLISHRVWREARLPNTQHPTLRWLLVLKNWLVHPVATAKCS